MDNLETKIISTNKNLLGENIINDLQQIINYINENILMKHKEKNDDEINLEEKDAQNKEIEFSETRIKLGKKRKKDKLSEKNKEKLNEAKIDKLKEYQSQGIEIIKLINNIITKIRKNNNLINDNKKNNNDINNNQEIKYDNGDRYVGQVLNGLREGKGIMYYNNGDRYEGEFRNDKREGKGIYYKKDGSKIEGNFQNNELQGKIIINYN